MTDQNMIQRTNFTCFHAGPTADWSKYRLGPPEVPMPVRGKLFLKERLGSTGLEMSLNVMPPGKGMPFLHKHQDNDEVYFVVEGRGQFLIDGECIDVEQGSVLRVSPQGERAWRNNSDAPLCTICIQYRADSVIQGGTQDGRKASGELNWPKESGST